MLDMFIPTGIASIAVSFLVPIAPGVKHGTVSNYSSLVEPFLWWFGDVEDVSDVSRNVVHGCSCLAVFLWRWRCVDF